LTSASSNIGIKELFNELGAKYLEQMGCKEINQEKGVKLTNEKNKNSNKKKKFC